MSADPSASHTSIRALRERRAANARDAELRRRVRELVGELVRDLIGAMLAGSPAEIADFLGSADRGRPRSGEARAVDAAARGGRSRSGKRSSMRPARGGATEPSEGERRPSVAPHSPFDITSPSELLASTDGGLPRADGTASRALEQAAPDAGSVSDATALAAGQESTPAAAAPSPLATSADAPHEAGAPAAPRRRRAAAPPPPPEPEAEAESERRPRIVLREGEQLLSATGSGVVIRRARVQTAR